MTSAKEREALLAEIMDESLDAEDLDRLNRARQHAREVLQDVETAPTTGPLKRDLGDNESMLAWALIYLAEAYEGLKGTTTAPGTRSRGPT